MPRTARLYLLNYPHHVTQRGVNKEQIFFDDEDYHVMLKYLKEASEKTSTEIWAYCLMPNHIHLLLVPTIEEGLGRCLHHSTFRYAQYFNKRYERTGRLWQNRYYSSIVEAETYLWAVARYIETNPLRSGLVRSPDEWRWSSASFHLNGTPDELIKKASDWLPEGFKERYREFLLDKADNTFIRKATLSCRPIGTEGFTSNLEALLNVSLKPRKRGRPRKCKN
jgi:putative transposase